MRNRRGPARHDVDRAAKELLTTVCAYASVRQGYNLEPVPHAFPRLAQLPPGLHRSDRLKGGRVVGTFAAPTYEFNLVTSSLALAADTNGHTEVAGGIFVGAGLLWTAAQFKFVPPRLRRKTYQQIEYDTGRLISYLTFTVIEQADGNINSVLGVLESRLDDAASILGPVFGTTHTGELVGASCGRLQQQELVTDLDEFGLPPGFFLERALPALES